MTGYQIAASVVVCQNNIDIVKKCIDSVSGANLKTKVYVVDNSPTDKIRNICCNGKINYIFNGANVGYGAGHNIAIKRAIQQKVEYHLVLNPDVYFESDVIGRLLKYMERNPDVGQVMPKILYPDGSLQRLCKLLPSPFDLFRRRFLNGLEFFRRMDDLYELSFSEYHREMEVPYLSGCFMFIRTEALRKVGLFDERFFMYMEDLDLSRRIHRHFRTVYYPQASIFHAYEKGSYKNGKLLLYHLVSAMQYFNKWGYFFDEERRTTNARILKKLMVAGRKMASR